MRAIDRLTWLAAAWALAVTLMLVGCDSTEPVPIDPPETELPETSLRLEAQSDTAPAGTVGTRLASIPVVRLTLDGKPAPGREIRFSASDGGSVQVSIQRTDTAGLASPGPWTLGTRAGPQTLTARVSGVGGLTFTFTAASKAGAPAAVSILAGNHQTAAAGAPLPTALQVKLADQYGNPVSDVPVTYGVILGAGTILGAGAKTDAHGFASSGTWTLGTAGAQLVTVLAAGQTILFDAFACDDRCRGRDLLFTSGRELFSLIDGTSTPLFTAPSVEGIDTWLSSAAWSSDGQHIAFTVWRYDWQQDVSDVALYLTNADGSHAVLREEGFSHPSWSPDGRRLAVTGPSGIYVMSAEPDGTEPLLLAESAFDPAWSPDGTRIAFADVIAETEFGYVGSLKLMHADGTAVTTILSDAGGTFAGPTWSPDGERLAFIKSDESGSRLLTVSAAGGIPVEVSSVVDATGPAWSPDGSRIAFRSLSSSEYGIVWVPADVRISTPIPMIPRGIDPAWRP